MEKLQKQRQISEQNRRRETQEMQACHREVRGSWASRNNAEGLPAAERSAPSPQQGRQASALLQRFEEDQEHRHRKREEEDRKIQQHKDEQRRLAEQLRARDRSESERTREQTRRHWSQTNDERSHRAEDIEAGAACREDGNSESPNCGQQQYAHGGCDDDMDFICPITLQPFEDPVEASDGLFYERR
jgi:hypothetical protein